jgi:hypothetical protein
LTTSSSLKRKPSLKYGVAAIILVTFSAIINSLGLSVNLASFEAILFLFR